MRRKRLPLIGLGLMMVGAAACGNAGPETLAGGKAAEGRPMTDGYAYEHDGWRYYSVYQQIALGGHGSREALIRLRVPDVEGIGISAPPVASLTVRLRDGEALSDENYSSLLYHDFYIRGPKAGTHKYLIELKPSEAKVEQYGSWNGRTSYQLSWTLPQVVGDRSNAKTWAISLTSQRAGVGQGAEISSFGMQFKSNLEQDDGRWYSTDFWPGEIPSALRVLEDVTLAGRDEPKLSASSAPCTLAAGSEYRFWDDITPLSARSRIISYKATRRVEVPETEWLETENGEWRENVLSVRVIEPGQIIEQLYSIEEGYCRVRRQGETETFEMDCLESSPDFDKADSALPSYEEYFQASCVQGNTAWVSASDMYSQVVTGAVQDVGFPG